MTTSTCDLAVDMGAAVGKVETPCECGAALEGNGCGLHDEVCGGAAVWMGRFAHCAAAADDDCCIRVVAICDPCRVELMEVAENAVCFMARYCDGKCPACGGKASQVSDLVLSLVAL